MAFKMKGMSFGKGTSYKSPQTLKAEAAMRMKKEAAMKMAKKDSAMDMANAAVTPNMMKKESPMTKKNQAERAAERLAKKEERLKAKMREERVKDTDSKKADKLDRRIANVANKRERKIKMAENIKAGKKGLRKRRANTRKTVDRPVVKTDKKFNEKGIKSDVTRTSKITGTTVTKQKSGTGTNKTIKKTVTKPKNVAQPKAPAKPTGPTFSQAFATARKAGKQTFKWTNPKTGKTGSYHTRTKEEDNVKKATLGVLTDEEIRSSLKMKKKSAMPLMKGVKAKVKKVAKKVKEQFTPMVPHKSSYKNPRG